MAKPRSYKLLCPIARGLDRVGDRWTLLILRDLHAGPARFTDLQRGLTGIAANLLTERLAKLVEDGLVSRATGPHGAALYELTDLGRKTRDLIFELAMFGALFPAEGETVAPGNLRTVAVTLGGAAARIETGDLDVSIALEVDGEPIAITANAGAAGVTYSRAEAPDVIIQTRYEALLSLADGQITAEDFMAHHCQIEVLENGKERDAFHLMALIMAVFD